MSHLNSTAVLENEPDTATTRAASPPKVGFVSLGCPKNLVDSEVMMGMLAQAGAALTPSAADADVIVVNTCSFIDSAQQESVNTILEMARHKNTGRARKLIVAGCLVERFRDEIRKNIPEVDAVVGTGELENILAAAGVAPAPEPSSPFRILTSRPEGDARMAQGRFSREVKMPARGPFTAEAVDLAGHRERLEFPLRPARKAPPASPPRKASKGGSRPVR